MAVSYCSQEQDMYYLYININTDTLSNRVNWPSKKYECGKVGMNKE